MKPVGSRPSQGERRPAATGQHSPLPQGDGTGVTLLIGEGIATMLSTREAAGHPVIASLSCGNLEPVAKEMRALYPAAALIIIADL